MRSVWEEWTVETGAPAPAPEDGERNDEAELSVKHYSVAYELLKLKKYDYFSDI